MYVLQIVIEDVMAADILGSVQEPGEVRSGISVKGAAIAFDTADIEDLACMLLDFGVYEGDGFQGGPPMDQNHR